jgi:hypothetical protein
MDIKYTLDKSNGSQTDIVPKSTYKELQTQPRLAKIYAFLHLHNKYKDFEVLMKIPDKYKDHPLGWMQPWGDKYKWANHLPLPELNGIWKPKETNQVEDDWATYDIKHDEYYYEIRNVTIVKNKRYKREKVETPIVEEKPRVRRQRPNRHVLLRQETVLNVKLEDLQKQEDDLTNEYQMAQRRRTIAKQELVEAVLAIEEVNKKSLDVKTRQNHLKEELKIIKIEIAKKNNKNGYVILAHDNHCKEQVYGYSKTLEDAQTIALEAVEMGTRRHEKRVAIETDFKVGAKIEAHWTNDNKWYGATIRKVTECKFDVTWTDGGKHTNGLELHQIRNITDYNKFARTRIVDLDTQMDIEGYGVDNSNRDIEAW